MQAEVTRCSKSLPGRPLDNKGFCFIAPLLCYVGFACLPGFLDLFYVAADQSHWQTDTQSAFVVFVLQSRKATLTMSVL